MNPSSAVWRTVYNKSCSVYPKLCCHWIGGAGSRAASREMTGRQQQVTRRAILIDQAYYGQTENVRAHVRGACTFSQKASPSAGRGSRVTTGVGVVRDQPAVP